MSITNNNLDLIKLLAIFFIKDTIIESIIKTIEKKHIINFFWASNY